jgi:hypothetical protein
MGCIVCLISLNGLYCLFDIYFQLIFVQSSQIFFHTNWSNCSCYISLICLLLFNMMKQFVLNFPSLTREWHKNRVEEKPNMKKRCKNCIQYFRTYCKFEFNEKFLISLNKLRYCSKNQKLKRKIYLAFFNFQKTDLWKQTNSKIIWKKETWLAYLKKGNLVGSFEKRTWKSRKDQNG